MSIWSRSSIPFPALDLIEAVAPFSATPVQNAAGAWVLGYGSTIDQMGRTVTANSMTISQSQAANVISSSMPPHLKAVAEVCWVPAQECQVAAMISLVAGEGDGVLANSALIAMFNAGRPDLAAQMFSRWVMAPDTSSAGGMAASLPLMRRRAIEAQVFTGVDVAAAVTAVNAMTADQLLALKTNGDALAAQWAISPSSIPIISAGVATAEGSSSAAAVAGS